MPSLSRLLPSTHIPAHLNLLLLLICASLGLPGCSLFWRTPPPEPPPVAFPALADPNTFEWETQILEASGSSEATAPPSGQTIPQRAFAARQSAKAAALINLREMVRQLPINETDQVGTAMDYIIAVQRGIELAVRRAKVVEEIPMHNNGSYQVRVRFSLAPVAEVLRQNYLMPGEPLPELPDRTDDALGPHT